MLLTSVLKFDCFCRVNRVCEPQLYFYTFLAGPILLMNHQNICLAVAKLQDIPKDDVFAGDASLYNQLS